VLINMGKARYALDHAGAARVHVVNTLTRLDEPGHHYLRPRSQGGAPSLWAAFSPPRSRAGPVLVTLIIMALLVVVVLDSLATAARAAAARARRGAGARAAAALRAPAS